MGAADVLDESMLIGPSDDENALESYPLSSSRMLLDDRKDLVSADESLAILRAHAAKWNASSDDSDLSAGHVGGFVRFKIGLAYFDSRQNSSKNEENVTTTR